MFFSFWIFVNNWRNSSVPTKIVVRAWYFTRKDHNEIKSHIIFIAHKLIVIWKAIWYRNSIQLLDQFAKLGKYINKHTALVLLNSLYENNYNGSLNRSGSKILKEQLFNQEGIQKQGRTFSTFNIMCDKVDLMPKLRNTQTKFEYQNVHGLGKRG